MSREANIPEVIYQHGAVETHVGERDAVFTESKQAVDWKTNNRNMMVICY